MKYLSIPIWALVLFGISFINCTAQDTNTTISIDELISRMENDSAFVILDVRNEYELTGPLGRIEKIIHIPLSELEERVADLKDYKDFFIAVICKMGIRSARAVKILRENGFKAYNVLGGMKEYRKKAGSD